MQLFEKMKAPGARPDLRPNLITYSVLLVSCRYARQYQLGVELYHELLQTQMRPNSYIFHAMLAICKEGALWEEGRAVLQAMQVCSPCPPRCASPLMLIRPVHRAYRAGLTLIALLSYCSAVHLVAHSASRLPSFSEYLW